MSADRPTTAHEGHDPSLVAAYAAGDAAGRELAEAEALVAGCAGCAALHRDLRAIAAALPALPPPARTRDFRISAEQAAGLRPAGARGALARLLAPLATARFAFAGPAGAGLAAVGIAGMLLSGGLGGHVMPTDRAAAPVTSTAGAGSGVGSGTGFEAPTGAPAPAVTTAPVLAPEASPAVTPLDHFAGVGPGAATASPVGNAGTTKATSSPSGANAQGGIATPSPAVDTSAAPVSGPTGADRPTDAPSPLTGPSALLLGVGVVLLALRLGARRALGSH